MFDLVIDLFAFLTFTETVNASSFSPGGEGSAASYFSTSISLVIKKVLWMSVLVAVLIATLAAMFLGLSELGFFGKSGLADQGRQMISGLTTGIPMLGVVLGMGAAFFNVFINTVEMSSDNRNNLKCIQLNSYCKDNGAFNSSQVRVNGVVENIYVWINISSRIALALSIVWIIWAGLSYINSAANVQKLEGAKRQLMWSGIGILTALSGLTVASMLNTIFFM